MHLVGPETTLSLRKSYIHGRYVDATSGETFASINPATNAKICDVEQAGRAEVDAAVESAAAGFEIWRSTSPVERQRVLLRAVALLRERNDELAHLETLDSGKPLQETLEIDVATGADVVEYYAGLTQALHGTTVDFPGEGFARMRREPLGVCAGIGAWNYPIQIAMWKSAPALACGNSMIFKPAELTPITAGCLAEIYTEAGLPDGVFNVVQGDAGVGQMLTAHPGIAKVSLTGEVETGKAVMAAASSSLKKVTLELGGKSPIVVFDDADFESALNAALANNFYSTGQVCSNGTRVFVQRGIYDDFVSAVPDRVDSIKVGDPFDPETQMGPLVSVEHYCKVASYMEAAKSSGARHLVGGGHPAELADGNYLSPAVFADCTDDMVFVTDEVFGPLMAILPFDSEDEVLERANATHYGLAGAVFTTDFARAHRVADALEAGIVWINDYNITPPAIPFGGYKQSGLGRENGLAAIEHYTQVKTIYANLGDVERTY